MFFPLAKSSFFRYHLALHVPTTLVTTLPSPGTCIYSSISYHNVHSRGVGTLGAFRLAVEEITANPTVVCLVSKRPKRLSSCDLAQTKLSRFKFAWPQKCKKDKKGLEWKKRRTEKR
ncbi:uncharacterized protein EI90DRAFT_2069518 [Cantharellus anzutake]|uniref:uncharacterized protein n=1 Tax=Cantharellus anzutake TaxID=1750568 RepID=UPI00190569D6|nr:uncharacterized protein EI90DRAFT_2069518 [Cantharellus anzutake]KAF8340481.1 hypothetical protein EI90DRAFT_2069518 [Cantharellus anzutake]